MEIKPIKTETDYQAALKEIERLFAAVPDTPEGDLLEVLTTLVEAYEEQHYRIPLPDPIEAIWPEALVFLADSSEAEAKALFEYLVGQHPDLAGVTNGALRTFQRRVALWRTQYGPDREVHFPQIHRPGEVMQFDWTEANELNVTIAGIPFPHLLAHGVLPYSNCEWAIPCRSESTLSLKAGVQAAFWALGGVTPVLQTDQSSTATHQLKRGEKERGFNVEY
ncbi:MAG: hypothetical protein NTY86_07975, partial [Deltaproteobacteria bacterium]|nr:hypothetical protein [Deltaproteobacteria bacterium]